MEKKDWLQTLKPGDEVAIRDRYGREEAVEVYRLTPSGRVIVRYGSSTREFNNDGYARGEDVRWGHSCLVPITPEMRERWEVERLASRLSNVRWGKHSLDTLRRVTAELDRPTEAEPS